MTAHPPEAGYPALRLHQRLNSAIRQAGIGEAWVQGTVSGFRPGVRFTSWELVDDEAAATTVAAVVQAGAFPRERSCALLASSSPTASRQRSEEAGLAKLNWGWGASFADFDTDGHHRICSSTAPTPAWAG